MAGELAGGGAGRDCTQHASLELRLEQLTGRVNLLTWMVGTNIILTLGTAVPCILLGILGLASGGPAGPPFFAGGWLLVALIWAPRIWRSSDHPRHSGIEIMPPERPAASGWQPHMHYRIGQNRLH